MKEKGKYTIVVVSAIVMLVSILGYTYSFFSARLTEVNKTETKIKTNELGIKFTGQTEISCTSMVPGNKCIKTFKVENTSSVKIFYNIYMEKITNEFNEDLVYTLTDESGTVVSETALPTTQTTKTYLKNNIELEVNGIKNYTLTIEFKYTEEDQNDYQGAEFRATVGIDTVQNITPPVTNPSGLLCKRATELHTKGSNSFGNLGEVGTLAAGDAFDCDVNGDGVYDKDTERFYYVSDYYNTTTQEFEEDTAALIYYSNTVNGQPNNIFEESSIYYYEPIEGDSAINWHGPVTALRNLPTTKQWKNISLKQNSRKLIDQSGGTSIEAFMEQHSFENVSYTGYAARFLTIQELKKSKNLSINTTDYVYSSANADRYLIENTKFYDSELICGYWLENSHSVEAQKAWRTNSEYLELAGTSFVTSNYLGTRPVIDVPKSQIEI